MKKYLLLILFLTSCKSITYQDVNPSINPNNNLLPALETLVDINNLESTYSSGSYVGQANNFGTGYSGNNGWGSWLQTTSLSGTQYKDSRVNDIINMFDKEVKENITTPYGEKKGYSSLKLGYRGSEDSFIYPLTSTLSLFTLNLVGFPWTELEESLEVEVQIMNNKKEIISRYTENVFSSNYVAMWWGYDENVVYRKVAADNIKQALERIRNKINTEASILNKKLK